MDRWWWYIIYIYSYCTFFFSSQWNVILSCESLSNLIFERILSYLIIFYPILLYLIIFYPTLSYIIVFYLTFMYLIIFYRIWSYLLPPVFDSNLLLHHIFFWILLEKREKGKKRGKKQGKKKKGWTDKSRRLLNCSAWLPDI